LHHSTAKAATLDYTKAAARELGPDHIPASTRFDRASSTRTSPPACALVLACDHLSSYVTGSEIDINGGSHIH
jgi:hypothetical protein